MKPFERKCVRQVDKSSPRLAARDGMEQGPYEFQRTRTALASEPKGKATHGEVRKPFLASKNLNHVIAAALLRRLAVCLRRKFSPANAARIFTIKVSVSHGRTNG
jgi:hypothetical protein